MMTISVMMILILLHLLQYLKVRYAPIPPPEKGFFLLLEDPAIIGHRGAAGSCPENTLASFREALKDAQGLELDVGMTKDGVIVVIHDETLERTTDGTGRVQDKNLEELMQLDASFAFKKTAPHLLKEEQMPIPTLEQVLETFPQTPLLIEVKGRGADVAQNLSRTIALHGAEERVLIAGKDDQTIQQIRNYLPGIQTGAALKEGILFYILAHLGLAVWFTWSFDGFFIPPRYYGLPLLTPPFRLAAKGMGLPIHLWTINGKEEINKYLSRGIQGIISDYPKTVRELVEEKKGKITS